MRRLARLVAVLTAWAILAGLVGPGGGAPQPAGAEIVRAGDYANQTLGWEQCQDFSPSLGPDAAGFDPFAAGQTLLECATFHVPRDWANPQAGGQPRAPGDAGGDLTIAVSRLRAKGAEPTGSLLTNPGGPGVPGRDVPLLFALQPHTEILSKFEIVGIDVRGAGASTNVGCDGSVQTGNTLDPRDRRPLNTDLILDAVSFLARGCQNAARALGPFITTQQTVHDLDLLRQLLMREKVSWVGYSGGTWLGAAYATYFPAHVDRFVFDSSVEFTADWQTVFDAQAPAFERRFATDFLPWAARYDSSFGLGTTPEAVRVTYETVRAALAAAPLELDSQTSVYATDVDNLLTATLYSTSSFQEGAEALQTLKEATGGRPPSVSQRRTLAGEVVAARRWRGHRGGRVPVSADSTDATFLSIICNDTPWIGDRASLLADSERLGRAYPLLGWYAMSDPCVFWTRPPTPPLRRPAGAGVPPILMVQSERDPATPIEGARRAAAGFAGAHLLVVADDGNHGQYMVGGNECVDTAVDNFLLDGTLPAPGAVCPGIPAAAPTPVDAPTGLLDFLTAGLLGRALRLLPADAVPHLPLP